MEELLNALQAGNEDRINDLACQLFIDRHGHPNRVEISKFQAFAPCRIFPLEQDSFGWLIGGIKYGDKVYSFG